MSSHLIAVTGTETPARDGGPLDALIEFYRAFDRSA
jgi:hypothetical protein